MSRSMPFTAWTPPSYSLTTLRQETSAMVVRFLGLGYCRSALGRTGGQTGHVVVHQERVDDDRRQRGEQVGRHDLAPLEHVAADQVADDADGEHHLVGRVEIRQWIQEGSPAHRESEDCR